MKKAGIVFGLLSLLIVFSACSNKETTSAPADSKQDNRPVTLQIMMTGQKSEFDKLFTNNPAMKQKLPNVTFEYSNLQDWDNIIASGNIPDMINLNTENFYRVLDNGLLYDHSDLVKKYKLDLNRFPKEQIDIIKLLSGNGTLGALPGRIDFPYTSTALAYNKDIFDKFAVPYPKDDMTWDEVLELARRLNRSDNGVQYRGLVLFQSWTVLRNQMNLNFTNNGKIDLSQPEWAEILNTIKRTAEVQEDWAPAVTGNQDPFIKDKTVAMLAGNVNSLILGASQLEGNLNWDMVNLPHFQGKPAVQPGNFGLYVITSKSKEKEIAMQSLQILYEDNTLKQQYEAPAVMKKNINAIKNQKIALNVPGKYDAKLATVFRSSIISMLSDHQDVNTALRNLKDTLKKSLAEQQGQ